jgi:hypothetical protein
VTPRLLQQVQLIHGQPPAVPCARARRPRCPDAGLRQCRTAPGARHGRRAPPPHLCGLEAVLRQFCPCSPVRAPGPGRRRRPGPARGAVSASRCRGGGVRSRRVGPRGQIDLQPSAAIRWAVFMTNPSFFNSTRGTWRRRCPPLHFSHSSAYATVSRMTVCTPMSTISLGATLAFRRGGSGAARHRPTDRPLQRSAPP